MSDNVNVDIQKAEKEAQCFIDECADDRLKKEYFKKTGIWPVSVHEEDHPEHLWFEMAQEQTLETLPCFIYKLLYGYFHDYGTIVHAISACALATIYAANKTPNGSITGFQASYVMWDIVQQMCFKGNKCGLKIINYDDMLYSQYEERFEKTIESITWEELQKEAKNLLETEKGAEYVRAHWQSIVNGVVPFGYKVEEEK